MIRIEVETLYDGEPVEKGCYVHFSPFGGADMVKKKVDTYQRILGDGLARVTIPLQEKQGGPGYSSILVGVEISVACDQNEDIINEVSDILMAGTMEIVDRHFRSAYEMLLTHRNELNEKLEEAGWSDG